MAKRMRESIKSLEENDWFYMRLTKHYKDTCTTGFASFALSMELENNSVLFIWCIICCGLGTKEETRKNINFLNNAGV